MRFILPFVVAAALAAPVAQAATVTDDAATVGLFFGDIYAEAAAPVSPEFALTYASLSGGQTFAPKFVLSLENGADQVLYAETDQWHFDAGTVLSFLFDLDDSHATIGDWLRVTFTFEQAISDPFGDATDLVAAARMAIVSGYDIPAVPVPATLPLLAGAMAMAAALGRRGRRA